MKIGIVVGRFIPLHIGHVNLIQRAISNCVINLEPEKQDVYNELYRILKKGGKFYISDIMLKKELPEEWRKSEKMHNT